jgi:hypothetical protein
MSEPSTFIQREERFDKVKRELDALYTRLKTTKSRKRNKQIGNLLKYIRSFDTKGVQGIVGLLKCMELPIVFKVSTDINQGIEHEHLVVKQFNEIGKFCPHFMRTFGMLHVDIPLEFFELHDEQNEDDEQSDDGASHPLGTEDDGTEDDGTEDDEQVRSTEEDDDERSDDGASHPLGTEDDNGCEKEKRKKTPQKIQLLSFLMPRILFPRIFYYWNVWSEYHSIDYAVGVKINISSCLRFCWS